MIGFFQSLLGLLLYPLILPVAAATNPENGIMRKIFTFFFSLLILLPLWIGAYLLFGFAVWVILQFGGVLRTQVPVAGASMLPTFDEEGFIDVYKFNQMERIKPDLTRGDVVVFHNQRTQEEFSKQGKLHGGFVKRIIGVPGDTLVIRNGFVYANARMLEEPYILQPRSTFGGKAIADCQVVKVPENYYFILGDNRKISMDSREIGLIHETDIDYYLPYQEQSAEIQNTRWRDPSNDKDYAYASEFNPEHYVELLNEKRAEAGVGDLTYEPLLSESARKRAKIMLKYDDLSFEATRSGYTMQDALAEVGYWNAVYGEVPTTGYYNEQELMDSFFEYPSSREFFLEEEYEDIGLSTFVGDLNGCPVQIVVQHLAGYKPPNYTETDISSWRRTLQNLQEVQPGWARLADSGEFYEENKEDIDRLNAIITLRIERLNSIVTSMESNEWLNGEQLQYMEEDDDLYQEQGNLADKLNKRIRE